VTKYVIFGASKRGESAIQSDPNREWCGFLDNDPRKWGTQFLGLPIISLDSFLQLNGDYRIVIASQYQMEIIEQLLSHNVTSFEVYWPVFRSKLDGEGEHQDFLAFDFDSALHQSERLAIFINNNSGSNTLALKKKVSFERLGIDTAFHHEHHKSSDYLIDSLRCKLAVVTHDKIFPSNTKAVQLWHGFPMKGLNFMSRYQPVQTRVRTRERWLQYSAVASYSSTYTSLMNACYGINAEQYVVTGMPRNDLLFESGAVDKLETTLGRKLNGRRVVLYMPTFRKTMYGQVNGDDNLQIFGFDRFNREALFEFLEREKLVLVVKPHPYHEDDFGLGAKDELPESVWVMTDQPLIENDYDFYEMLAAADLLITDYSSVYFDYLLLDKPIIFTPTDADKYKETRGFLIEPYDFWAPGPQCFDQISLQKEILRQLDKPKSYISEREVISKIVHHYRDNESSQRVAKLIVEQFNET